MDFNTQTHISTDGQACLETATLRHGGREYTANGAFVSDTHLTGYLAKDKQTGAPIVTTFDGVRIGSARIVKSWQAPHGCYLTDRFYQVECTADVSGIVYSGRTAGFNMLYRAKRKANQ